MYEYAHYNETILGNRSLILCFTLESQKKYMNNDIRLKFTKFQQRFSVIEIKEIEEMAEVIDRYSIHAFMCQQPGIPENHIYKYDDPKIWKSCKTIKYCVFFTQFPEESSCSVTVSHWLNEKNNTHFTVLPCIVSLPDVVGDLREELGIPKEATVFGGYGGRDNFDIELAQRAVYLVAKRYSSIYFLFANFKAFCEPLPNIIHCPTILDKERKVKFIQTCDAMLWARSQGETFGLAIAEFSIKNRPIFCMEIGDLAHIRILKEKAILYTTSGDLAKKLIHFTKEPEKDWNAYTDYTPEKVMSIFKDLI